MKDARQYLNKKRNQSAKKPDRLGGLRAKASTGAIDARKILNMKRAGKTSSKKKSFSLRTSQGSRPMGIPVIRKPFSAQRKMPEKRVEVAGDGNIWITSKAKHTGVTEEPKPTSSFIQRPRWTPANVSMDNLELVGIEDVIDMESLPPAMVSTGQLRNRVLPSRSLAQDVLSMRNTMVADQVASTSTYRNARVIVSNLQPSVSKQDLLELFGDIGLIKNAEITYPGSAVIEYHNFEDAEEAVSTYHNRLLDGQPMQCYLQPSQNRASVSQRLGERIHNSIPASFASSSSMASNPRSHYNPRDVRFTVKMA